MQLGKTLTILALSASILASGCHMGTSPQKFAQVDNDRPVAEMVIEDHYNPVHDAGHDAIQKEATVAGIDVMAPSEIHEKLTEPSVEGTNSEEIQSFSARFESANGAANYEIVCTNQGVGQGLANGNGPLTQLGNGIILQAKNGGYASDWFAVGNGKSQCQVVTQGMTLNQTVHMTSSLQTFTPDSVGYIIAQ